MACNRNRRSRHFELTQEQINAILFAESSNSECDDLDEEDAKFLEADIQELNKGDNEKTLVIIDGSKVKRKVHMELIGDPKLNITYVHFTTYLT